jgi:hypothetical protein
MSTVLDLHSITKLIQTPAFDPFFFQYFPSVKAANWPVPTLPVS